MSNDYVKRIRYPREDIGDTDAGRIAQTIPALAPDNALSGIITDWDIMPKGRRLDVRRDTPDSNDWVVGFAEEVENIYPAAIDLQTSGYMLPKRLPVLGERHIFGVDAGAWAFENIPVTTYTSRLFPAMDFQSRSFRTQRMVYTKPGRTGTPRSKIDDFLVFPAADQLLQSYRSSVRDRYRNPYHDWLDDQGGIIEGAASNEFIPSFWAAIDEFKGELNKTHIIRSFDLWNSTVRSFAAFFEDVEILSSIFDQQRDSFRMPKGKRMGQLETMHDQDGWIGFQEREIEVLRQVGVHRLLSLDYPVPKRKQYSPPALDWTDWQGWLPEAAAFDEETFNAIDFLSHAFRQGQRKPLNLNYLDTLLDTGWMRFTSLFEVPKWIAGIDASTNSYRMQDRRITMDTLRIDDFPPFSFLHDVLDLIDAEFGQPRAHWRHIEGAIRARRRKRGRR